MSSESSGGIVGVRVMGSASHHHIQDQHEDRGRTDHDREHEEPAEHGRREGDTASDVTATPGTLSCQPGVVHSGSCTIATTANDTTPSTSAASPPTCLVIHSPGDDGTSRRWSGFVSEPSLTSDI